MQQQTASSSQSNLHEVFGVISLVLGILAFLFSFIFCLGTYAVFPGVLGLIFGIVAFIMAGKVNAPKGFIIAGILLSILGTGVATWQYIKLKQLTEGLRNDPKKMEAIKSSLDSLKQSLEELDSTTK